MTVRKGLPERKIGKGDGVRVTGMLFIYIHTIVQGYNKNHS